MCIEDIKLFDLLHTRATYNKLPSTTETMGGEGRKKCGGGGPLRESASKFNGKCHFSDKYRNRRLIKFKPDVSTKKKLSSVSVFQRQTKKTKKK